MRERKTHSNIREQIEHHQREAAAELRRGSDGSVGTPAVADTAKMGLARARRLQGGGGVARAAGGGGSAQVKESGRDELPPGEKQNLL